MNPYRRMTLDHPQIRSLGSGRITTNLFVFNGRFRAMIERMKVALEREYASETNEIKAQLFALQVPDESSFSYTTYLQLYLLEAQRVWR